MHETGKELLHLMFRPGETICVSHNMFGYHSIPFEVATELDIVTLVPTPDSCIKRGIDLNQFEYIPSDNLILVALNPIFGFRVDSGVTKYRNFLVEMDSGPIDQQIKHIKSIGLPYSAAIFSGGKSIHFLISLENDLPSEDHWRHIAEWTLSAIPLADQLTKNPSRSIRIPGAYRPEAKMQELVEMKGPVKIQELLDWLNKYPDSKPKKSEKRERVKNFDASVMKSWVKDALEKGLDPKKGRNLQWFAIACEFALAGFSENGTLDILGNYFVEDRDFKTREWRSAIKSGFKHIYENRKLVDNG